MGLLVTPIQSPCSAKGSLRQPIQPMVLHSHRLTAR